VVQRRLLHGGRALRAGYVEAVAVAASHRRRGLASAVMAELEGVIHRAYDLGALSATDAGAALYASRGWQLWRGPISALTPSGTVRTPHEDGALHVLPCAAPLDLTGELTGDWRDGDPW
jgi:aminoglycoside 2'-N-acetyltransferase I